MFVRGVPLFGWLRWRPALMPRACQSELQRFHFLLISRMGAES